MFGFKKRPENDISQYFAMIPRDTDWIKNSIEIINVTERNLDIALNKEDPFSKNVSLKSAIKYAKKHGTVLSCRLKGWRPKFFSTLKTTYLAICGNTALCQNIISLTNQRFDY